MKTNEKGKKKHTTCPRDVVQHLLGVPLDTPSHSPIILVVVVLMAVVIKTAHCPIGTIMMWCRSGGDICRLRW